MFVVDEQRQRPDEVLARREYLDVRTSVRSHSKVLAEAHPSVQPVVVCLYQGNAVRDERIGDSLASHRITHTTLLPHIGRGDSVRDVLGKSVASLVESEALLLDEPRHLARRCLVLVDFLIDVQVSIRRYSVPVHGTRVVKAPVD